jgi:hypothetical protein
MHSRRVSSPTVREAPFPNNEEQTNREIAKNLIGGWRAQNRERLEHNFDKCTTKGLPQLIG